MRAVSSTLARTRSPNTWVEQSPQGRRPVSCSAHRKAQDRLNSLDVQCGRLLSHRKPNGVRDRRSEERADNPFSLSSSTHRKTFDRFAILAAWDSSLDEHRATVRKLASFERLEPARGPALWPARSRWLLGLGESELWLYLRSAEVETFSLRLSVRSQSGSTALNGMVRTSSRFRFHRNRGCSGRNFGQADRTPSPGRSTTCFFTAAHTGT